LKRALGVRFNLT